jgi:hypothetical protein
MHMYVENASWAMTLAYVACSDTQVCRFMYNSKKTE